MKYYELPGPGLRLIHNFPARQRSGWKAVFRDNCIVSLTWSCRLPIYTYYFRVEHRGWQCGLRGGRTVTDTAASSRQIQVRRFWFKFRFKHLNKLPWRPTYPKRFGPHFGITRYYTGPDRWGRPSPSPPATVTLMIFTWVEERVATLASPPSGGK